MRLAAAVIRQAMVDADGTGKPAAHARAWLAGGGPMLRHWLHCAGISHDALREWVEAGRPAPPSSPARTWDARDDETADEAA